MDHAAGRLFRSAALLSAMSLAACEVPAEARRDLPPVVDGPAPELAPTASFDVHRSRVAESEAALAEDAANLALRAERLRSQADALTAPVLTDAERDRLAAGG